MRQKWRLTFLPLKRPKPKPRYIVGVTLGCWCCEGFRMVMMRTEMVSRQHGERQALYIRLKVNGYRLASLFPGEASL